jgi:hypothetical protein
METKEPATSTSTSTMMESLSDDEVGLILSFTDFPTAARTALTVSKSWQTRLLTKDSFHHVWQNMYHQQHFSVEQLSLPVPGLHASVHSNSSSYMYIQHARARRQLLLNLLQNKNNNKRSKFKQPNRSLCFNLPNRFFRFLPITPQVVNTDDQMLDWDDNDPPPVDFDCDSFILTSSGVSGEMLLLDPFSGVVSVYDNVLEKAVAVDCETDMDQGMNMVASASVQVHPTMNANAHAHDNARSNPYEALDDDDVDDDVGNMALDDDIHSDNDDPNIVHSNMTTAMDPYHTGQRQVLIDVQDYLDISLSDYFEQRPGRVIDHDNNEVNHDNDTDNEVEVTYVGTESKPILQQSSTGNGLVVTGTMVAVGRALSHEPLSGAHGSLRCVELLAWFRSNAGASTSSGGSASASNMNMYGDHHVCRFPSGFHSIAICAVNRRLYVGFRMGGGPDLPGMANDNDNVNVMRINNNNEDDDDDNNNNQDDEDVDAENRRHLGRSTIVVYPLVPFVPKEETDNRHSQQQHSATTTSTTPPRYFPDPIVLIQCGEKTSAIAVSATGNELLVGTTNSRIQVWEIDLIASGSDMNSNPAPAQAAAAARRVETLDLKASLKKSIKALGRSGVGAPCVNKSPIQDFHVPRHLSIATCGFVTVQHNRNDGTTAVLWRKGESGGYEAQSMINLPLSAQRLPKVHYDGRRLIVFGQDHIGMIILVYHVLNTNQDTAYFSGVAKDDSSGGVTNFTDPPRIRFANRIRNVALGGLEFFEHIHMTCNERFIVINTKTGNLSSSGSSILPAEGLLVIDLEDHNA